MQNPCEVPIKLFLNHFVKVQMVQPYNITDIATALKHIHFISSDFQVADSMSIEAYDIFYVDITYKISMKCSPNCRGLALNVSFF